jgi:electron-transferring-flavoprotein dehydrogenase
MSMEELCFDVVIVGGGPAGLAAAIRLRQLAMAGSRQFSVCLLEKGATVGAHILSGAIMDIDALAKLIPDWQSRGAPLRQQVTGEKFQFLSANSAYPLPAPPFANSGCYIISLGELTVWLAEQAEEIGVEIYPGFVADQLLYDDQGRVEGIVTGAMGVGKNGEKKANFQSGLVIKARQTLLAEGCRGHLSRQVIRRFNLDGRSQPQRYSLGIKELWQVDSPAYQCGLVTHSVGWPLQHRNYGGGFVYHQDGNKVAIGLIMGLDYANPDLDPFWEFQQFKTHPVHRQLLRGGRCIGFGARTLVEGGLQSLPELAFPGGLLLGDGAGLLDVGRMKGSHGAIFSGQLAAEAVFSALPKASNESSSGSFIISAYEADLRASWLGRDLHRSRNLRPGFGWGLAPGLLYGAVDQWLLKGQAPWTLMHSRVAERMDGRSSADTRPITYPRADGCLIFDKPSSLYRAGVAHEENQPCHLKTAYTEPKDNQRRNYCPAQVFATVITPANCLHCKTCDIKDFDINFCWSAPEGGGGPNYLGM